MRVWSQMGVAGYLPFLMRLDWLQQTVPLIRKVGEDEVHYVRIVEVRKNSCKLSHHFDNGLMKVLSLLMHTHKWMH